VETVDWHVFANPSAICHRIMHSSMQKLSFQFGIDYRYANYLICSIYMPISK
jgi:hypothetical protein